MVRVCSYNRCRNKGNAWAKQNGISFHVFPRRNSYQFEKWLAVMKHVNSKDWEPDHNSQLCSSHFKESDFERGRRKRKSLMENTVPSKFETANFQESYGSTVHMADGNEGSEPCSLYVINSEMEPVYGEMREKAVREPGQGEGHSSVSAEKALIQVYKVTDENTSSHIFTVNSEKSPPSQVFREDVEKEPVPIYPIYTVNSEKEIGRKYSVKSKKARIQVHREDGGENASSHVLIVKSKKAPGQVRTEGGKKAPGHVYSVKRKKIVRGDGKNAASHVKPGQLYSENSQTSSNDDVSFPDCLPEVPPEGLERILKDSIETIRKLSATTRKLSVEKRNVVRREERTKERLKSAQTELEEQEEITERYEKLLRSYKNVDINFLKLAKRCSQTPKQNITDHPDNLNFYSPKEHAELTKIVQHLKEIISAANS